MYTKYIICLLLSMIVSSASYSSDNQSSYTLTKCKMHREYFPELKTFCQKNAHVAGDGKLSDILSCLGQSYQQDTVVSKITIIFNILSRADTCYSGPALYLYSGSEYIATSPSFSCNENTTKQTVELKLMSKKLKISDLNLSAGSGDWCASYSITSMQVE